MLAAPTMRVRVRERLGREQAPGGTQVLDDTRIGIEDAHAAELCDLGKEAARVVDGRVDVEVIAASDVVILLAMTGRGVHQAGAGLERHVLAENEQRIAIDPWMPRVRAFEIAAGDGRLHRRVGVDERAEARQERLGDDRQPSRARRHHDVLHVGVGGDREVRGQGPGRRRPDRDVDRRSGERPQRRRVRLAQRERDVHRRGRDVAIFDLRLRERGATRRAPVHRLLAAIEIAARRDFRELADLGRLVGEVHREIWRRPVAEDAEALELVLLDRHETGRVVAAEAADLELRERRLLLLAETLLDLELDRQPVAVPAGHVRSAIAAHILVLDDDVLHDLVERVAEMDVAVGVRRTVVEHVARTAGALRQHARVETVALPAREDLGLARRQIAAHRERRDRKVEGRLEVGRRFRVHRNLGIDMSARERLAGIPTAMQAFNLPTRVPHSRSARQRRTPVSADRRSSAAPAGRRAARRRNRSASSCACRGNSSTARCPCRC